MSKCYIRAYVTERKRRIRAENENAELRQQSKERIAELESLLKEYEVRWERRSERSKLLAFLDKLKSTDSGRTGNK